MWRIKTQIDIHFIRQSLTICLNSDKWATITLNRWQWHKAMLFRLHQLLCSKTKKKKKQRSVTTKTEKTLVKTYDFSSSEKPRIDEDDRWSRHLRMNLCSLLLKAQSLIEIIFVFVFTKRTFIDLLQIDVNGMLDVKWSHSHQNVITKNN